MALSDPLQLIVIAALVIMLLVFGPNKIPELARALGRAKKEFDGASKELQQVTGGLSDPASLLDRLAAPEPTPAATPAPATADGQPPAVATQGTQAPAATAAPATAPKSSDELLIETAKTLGIVTEGKTKEEIAAAIVAMSKPVQPLQA